MQQLATALWALLFGGTLDSSKSVNKEQQTERTGIVRTDRNRHLTDLSVTA